MNTLSSTLQRFKMAALKGHQADKLVEVQDALKEKSSAGLKKAVDDLNGPAACRYLIEAMIRTATKPTEVGLLLGRLK